MKLVSFNCTIEVSKDENGYSNNYYVDVTDKGVSISHPYVTQSPEQVMLITKLIHDIIGTTIDFNRRIDSFNRDMKLEQYTPKVSQIEESTTEALAETAVLQPSRGASSTEIAEVTMESAKDDEEMLKVMLASGLKEE